MGGPTQCFWVGHHNSKWSLGKQHGFLTQFATFTDITLNQRCVVTFERFKDNKNNDDNENKEKINFFIDSKKIETQERNDTLYTFEKNLITIGAGFDTCGEPWYGTVYAILIEPLI